MTIRAASGTRYCLGQASASACVAVLSLKPGQFLRTRSVTVNHQDMCGARERHFHRDRPSRSTSPEEDHSLLGGIDDVSQRHDKPRPSVFSPMYRSSRGTTVFRRR